MRIEEIEHPDGLVIRAELPGIDHERDLDVRIRGHVLEIRAERTPEPTSADEHRRSEFHYGRLWRLLTLPRLARESEVSATYCKGILEVRVPFGEAGPPDATRVAVAAGPRERS
jgi:HSP20 family molecular chaperone IbpA